MTKLYVIKNSEGAYLGKQGEWLDGSDPGQLYKSKNHDEALNSLVEANSKDFRIRADVLACEINAKGLPNVSIQQQGDMTFSAESENSRSERTASEANTPNLNE